MSVYGMGSMFSSTDEQLDNFIRQNLKAINADAKIADLCKNKRNSLTK